MHTLSSLPETWTRAGRDAARAVVRAADNYSGWLAANPTVDRNGLTKADIAKAAGDLGVADQVAAAVWQEMRASGHIASDEEVAVAAGEPAAVDPAKDWPAGPAAIGMGAAAVDTAAVDAAIDSVLSPVRGFLSDGLVAGLADRIRPIAVDALKPAVEVVREVVREVAAAPVAPAGVAPYAKVTGRSTMSKTFAVRGDQAALPVALWDAADAPELDPSYQVDPSVMGQVVTALEHGETLWLAGSAGTGKGSLVIEYAARTGRPFVRIGFSRSTEIVDLLGQSEPRPAANGGVEMVWVDRVFVQAIRRPGTVILLDELMISPPGTVAVFQTILDTKSVTLPTGEVVKFAPGVVVIIADNSAGYGDETGAYAGVQPANAALVDRCGRLVIVDYLPPKLEASAVHGKTGLPYPAALRLAEFAKVVRTAASKAGGDSRPFSIRRLIAFAVATYRDKLTVAVACQSTFLSRLPEADRTTLRVAFEAHFKVDAYLAEMNGEIVDTTPPAPLSNEPEQVEARDTFGRS